MNQIFWAQMHGGATHFPIASLMVSVVFDYAGQVRAVVDAQLPEGYEDESGFHFGSPTFKS